MRPVLAPLASGRSNNVVAYALAACIGVCWLWAVFPGWALLGQLPPGSPTNVDLAQHIVGQRYFWADAWHWRHPLRAQSLDVPYGVMIGFTDSIPLPTLLAKPFVPLLPTLFQGITMWLAFAWFMQPVAAVFALRSAGERRWLPALTIAACASAMPTFLARMSHAALSSHFFLLIGLGLALRLVDPARPRRQHRIALFCACLLIPVLLLIHPYLMMMDIILAGSAPLTLLIRRDRRWRGVAVVLGLSVLATAILAGLLGYFEGSDAASGFGVYSMNLLSPIWPSESGLLGPAAPVGLDATGGQYEGYQYLGAGLLLGLGGTAALWRRRLFAVLGRQPGLLISCAVLCAVAISTTVYLGHLRILALPAPGFMGIFRVSGRFFWPVAYALLVGVVAMLARLPRQLAVTLLVLMAVLQSIDASHLGRTDKVAMFTVTPYPFDADALARLMAQSRFVDIPPAWPCNATIAGAKNLMTVLSVASRVLVPVDTAYSARATHPPHCDDARTVATVLAPGELRILLPSRVDMLNLVPDHARFCQRLGTLAVCHANEDQSGIASP
jgi:hypothetical protein